MSLHINHFELNPNREHSLGEGYTKNVYYDNLTSFEGKQFLGKRLRKISSSCKKPQGLGEISLLPQLPNQEKITRIEIIYSDKFIKLIKLHSSEQIIQQIGSLNQDDESKYNKYSLNFQDLVALKPCYKLDKEDLLEIGPDTKFLSGLQIFYISDFKQKDEIQVGSLFDQPANDFPKFLSGLEDLNLQNQVTKDLEKSKKEINQKILHNLMSVITNISLNSGV